MLLMFLCHGVLINSIVSSFWLDFHRKTALLREGMHASSQVRVDQHIDSLVLLCEGVHSIPIQLSNLAQHDCAYCSGIKTSVLNKVCFQNVML